MRCPPRVGHRANGAPPCNGLADSRASSPEAGRLWFAVVPPFPRSWSIRQGRELLTVCSSWLDCQRPTLSTSGLGQLTNSLNPQSAIVGFRQQFPWARTAEDHPATHYPFPTREPQNRPPAHLSRTFAADHMGSAGRITAQEQTSMARYQISYSVPSTSLVRIQYSDALCSVT